MMKTLKHTYSKFLTGNYNVLLIFLVLLFIFRPFDPGTLYLGFWKVFFTATLMAAIFNCDHVKTVKNIVTIMAIPSVALTWLDLFFKQEIVIVSFAFFNVLFIFVCAASILYDVIVKPRVTSETLRGVICVYFLVAFMFSYIYFLLEYINPGTMLINGKVISVFPHPYYLAQMLYYSFTTLLTIGFGDIISVKDLGQTATVLEAIIGQFYIAILVSKLVAVYSFITEKTITRDVEKDLKHKKLIP